jgi:hypothetical protein
MVAAFGVYACMYGFRKPFTAGGYGGTGLKTWLVTAQVLGYTTAKLIGIKVIAEMTAGRRAAALVGLIGLAELSLVLFAVTPPPYNAVWLFLNGLPLGLVFGLVLGFLEGRRLTELFVAGLCASFILADGFSKSVGLWLLQRGVPELWMPSVAGAVFILPLLGFLWMLAKIPPPSSEDRLARSERAPMTGAQRLEMIRRHGWGLLAIVLAYLFITVLRSVRADFALEIWASLGLSNQAGVFTRSEMWVTLAVVLANGALVLIRDNRRAFLTGLGLCVAGLGLAAGSVLAFRSGVLSPFAFMVLLGLGMYVPYVAVHTTIFERIIALTRERGNVGFLMYVADAAGYLGYAGVILGRSAFPATGDFLGFFLELALGLMGVAFFVVLAAWMIFLRKFPSAPTQATALAPLVERDRTT